MAQSTMDTIVAGKLRPLLIYSIPTTPLPGAHLSAQLEIWASNFGPAIPILTPTPSPSPITSRFITFDLQVLF